MNRNKSFTAVIAFAAVVLSADADHVKLSDLPQAAQNTINRSKGSDAIAEIDRQTRDGQTVYEVKFDRPGANPKLIVAENGIVLNDQKAGTAVAAAKTPSLHLSDLPEPVRRTITTESRGRTITDIDKELWKDQPIYEAEFEQEGRNAVICVAENGSLVKDERVGTGLAGIFPGTQLEDLSPAAQKTIKDQAGGGKIADIDKESHDGKVVYEVTIEKDGADHKLHVAENGTLVSDRAAGAGAPATQVRTETETARRLTVGELPAAVQNTIRAESGMAKEIQSVTKDGKRVYRVEFSQTGKNKVVHIAEDGKIVQQ